jgi:transaldolase
MPSLLDNLRESSRVDCDTLDESIASTLGPFVDCTSNQAIVYLELVHTRHEGLLREAKQKAAELKPQFPNDDEAGIAADIAVCVQLCS